MLFTPSTLIIASQAQRRMFDGVRLDGAVELERPAGRVRTGLAAAFARTSRLISPASTPARARHLTV